MSTEPVIPPRPDGLHPGPLEPGGAPAAPWGWVEAVGIYFLAFLAAGVATVPVFAAMGEESDLASIVATVVAAVTIIGVLLLWLFKAHPGWPAVVRMPVRRRWRSDAGAGAVFGVGLYPVAVVVVGGIVLTVLEALSGETVQAPEQVPQDLSPVGLAVTILYAVVIAPFGEELFFRGVLFRALRDRFGFAVGAGGSGVAFGLIHYIPGPAIDAALLILVMTFVGAAFAFIYERRGSFTAPLAAHVTFNVIGIVLILGLIGDVVALFPSEEWITLYRGLINGSEEYREAGRTWEGDIAFVFEAEPDRGVAVDLVAWLRLRHGVCHEARMIEADDGARAEYEIRAPYSRWREVVLGDLDPVKGMMQGKLKVRGDLPNIVRHVRAANELVHLTTQVPTEFIGGG